VFLLFSFHYSIYFFLSEYAKTKAPFFLDGAFVLREPLAVKMLGRELHPLPAVSAGDDR